jgi:hypothetical protein
LHMTHCCHPPDGPYLNGAKIPDTKFQKLSYSMEKHLLQNK